MIKEDNAKIIAPFFLLISALIVGFIYQFNGSQLQDIRGRAEGPTCDDRCVNPPSCCAEIAETGDAFACSWEEGRGWCPPDVCSKIQGKGQKCGWYWVFHGTDDPNGLGTNTANGYGCMIGESEATMRPTCGGNPVLPAQPTSIPTAVPIPTQIVIIPTSVPIPTAEILPTSPPLPTQIIRIEPTTPRTQITSVPIRYPTNPPPPTLIPTNAPFKVSLPDILPPKEKVDSFILQIQIKLYDFFSKILP